MNLSTKIKAGAIQYVLVVSVIIIIVLFAFISLVFLQKRVQLKSDLQKEAIHATYLAFDYLKENRVPYNTETKLSFTEYDFENTSILKKKWGVFDLGIATSNLRNETFQKIALLGNENANRKAIYLQENNQPLVVVGNTKITGNVTLPKRGVKTGNIAGNSYYGNKLIYGKIATNANQLPKIQNLAYLRQLLIEIPIEDQEYFRLEEGMKLNQSFAKQTLVFESEVDLVLREVTLQGNVILVSKSKIQIEPSAQLENIIVIAPEVIINSNVKGNFQVFASKRIHVKQDVALNYPTSLVLLKQEDSKLNAEGLPELQIDQNSIIKGVVLYHTNDKKGNGKTQILIDERANVTGEVYCNKNLELKGRVDGFVYTNSFIAKEFGGAYLNHIYNGEIDATSISEKYNGLFIDNEKRRVAKWVE